MEAIFAVLVVLLVAQVVSAVALWRLYQQKSLPTSRVLRKAEAAISEIIREGRLVAEQMTSNNAQLGHKTNNAEKQRAAIAHIKKRLAPLGLDLDYSTISLRLEAEVAGAKEAPRKDSP